MELDTVYPLRYNARAVSDDKVLNPERERLAAEMMLHLDHLYRVAFYLAKNDADAQDCVQETCARALHAHRQFASGTNLKAWLTRILYNFFFDASARDKKTISKDGLTGEATQGSSYWETVAADDPGPEDEILQQELHDDQPCAEENSGGISRADCACGHGRLLLPRGRRDSELSDWNGSIAFVARAKAAARLNREIFGVRKFLNHALRRSPRMDYRVGG